MDEVLDVASDLRGVGVEMLTIGQYLQPTPQNLPVERFVPPEEFDWIGEQCRRMATSWSPADRSYVRATTPAKWPGPRS